MPISMLRFPWPCRTAASGRTVADRCCRGLALSTDELLDWLPQLGNVLCVYSQAAAARLCPRGILRQTPETSLLLHTHTLLLCNAVCPQGPCEWFQCLDEQGRPLLRAYLLPDTDFAAWDGILRNAAVRKLPRSADHAPLDRPSPARVVRFEFRGNGACRSLRACPASQPRAACSEAAARRLARSEALALA